MLQFIRDNATGWIAWGIVILISIPFALWGIHQYVTPTSSVAIATVDDTEIGYYEFQRRYALRRQQLQSLLGASLIDPAQEDRIRREVLDQMIDSQVVLGSGASAGMRIGDGQLAGAIQGQDAFRSEGGFSQQLYEGWLRSQGYSPGGFEEDLRRTLLEQQVLLGVSQSDFLPAAGIRDAVRLRLQKRTFSVLTIPATDFAGREPTESEIAAHYEQHRSDYRAPERVRLRYLEISMDEIAAGIKADDEELRATFDAEPDRYLTPEKREVSHILVAVDSGTEAGADERARQRLLTVRGRIEAGESFEDLAREVSDDPGSANAGGALGFIEPGIMDPAFEEAAFSLAPEELSDPVRSSFGWHLVKVTSVHQPESATFDEVRDQVLVQYQSREAERIFAERVDTLANVTYERPESLEPAAVELGLPIRETDPVTRDGRHDDLIASQPAVLAAAFSSDVLVDGNNSEPIEFETGHVVVVRTFDHEPSRPLDLYEAHETIAAELRSVASRAAVTKRGEDLLADLRVGRSPTEVAADTGLEWTLHDDIERFGGGVPERLREVVFRMPRPDTGVPPFDGVLDDHGDYAIVSLSRVDDGDLSSLDEDETRALRQALEAELGRSSFDAFVRSRRQSSDVRVVEENLSS